MRVTPSITIDESEIEERFIRASGPGGQNVNKVASAVQLRFDARGSRALPDAVAVRLIKLAGARATKEGVIVIEASRLRTQAQNREDARARLKALIAKAAIPPRKRVATRPTRASKERRMESKKQRGEVKAGRRRIRPDA